MNPKTDGRSRTIISAPFGENRVNSGLLRGTTVMTLDGELPVEHLTRGDRIITRDTGMAVLRGVDVAIRRARCVRITARTLGTNRPDGDLILPAQTAINIRDWRAKALYGADAALIPAYRLIDGEFITDMGNTDVRMYELRFDTSHILYAGGMEIVAPQYQTTQIARHA
ncbi:MAG: Hint domain-containing protein [Paracoccaceae bacterium]|jgi:hypothetical protein|nr:Hint domain-containing protein [Paracoccaceae bacterium]